MSKKVKIAKNRRVTIVEKWVTYLERRDYRIAELIGSYEFAILRYQFQQAFDKSEDALSHPIAFDCASLRTHIL